MKHDVMLIRKPDNCILNYCMCDVCIKQLCFSSREHHKDVLFLYADVQVYFHIIKAKVETGLTFLSMGLVSLIYWMAENTFKFDKQMSSVGHRYF